MFHKMFSKLGQNHVNPFQPADAFQQQITIENIVAKVEIVYGE